MQQNEATQVTETKTPAEKDPLEDFSDKVFDNLHSMAIAQNLLRKPGVEKRRETRTLLEIRIGATPKAYDLQRRIIEASKDGIHAAKNGYFEDADRAIESAKIAWQELLQLPMRADRLHEFVSAAGQELVELMAVTYLTPALDGDYEQALQNFARLPMPDDLELGIPYEAWLAGLEDTVTELGKLMNDILVQEQPPLAEQEKIAMRMLMIGKALYDFLQKFENENKAVTDNSHHRGQGYKDKLRRVWIYISERLQPLVMEIQRQRKLEDAMNQATERLTKKD